MTKLTQSQKITRSTKWTESGDRYSLIATVRHDDECGNGHNSFAITGELRINGRMDSCGCLHELIAERIPELAPFIKWHLCSADEPMHYISNTVYHASAVSKHQDSFFIYFTEPLMGKEVLLGIDNSKVVEALCKKYGVETIRTKDHFNGLAKEPNLEHARSSAIWPDATLEQLLDEDALRERLPALMADFQADVESLNLVF